MEKHHDLVGDTSSNCCFSSVMLVFEGCNSELPDIILPCHDHGSVEHGALEDEFSFHFP